MGSLVWLGLAALFVVAIVLSRTTPKGAKPVANTRLMGAARYVLVLGAIMCGAFGVFGTLRH
jgi:hypothetical protein